MTTRTSLGIAASALALAAVPLVAASPAHAATYQDGCIVSPVAPEFRQTWNSQNRPYVYYDYTATCVPSTGPMTVEVETKTWDQDTQAREGDTVDDYIGTATTRKSFIALGGVAVGSVRGVLPHTDTDFDEEVYHTVRFRVISGNVTGAWTAVELSQPTTISW